MLMKNNLPCNILLASTLMLSCCQIKSQTPIKWTSTTEIKAYHGGGMAAQSQTVEIKGLNGLFINWVMPKTDSFRFKLTQKEADNIVKQIHTTHFLSLRSVESKSIAYDAPTTSIELKYNSNRTHMVSEGATMEIRAGRNVEFSEFYDFILAYVLKKTNQKL